MSEKCLYNLNGLHVGFHWKDGWFFNRENYKGDVHICHHTDVPKYEIADLTLRIPSSEWCSIVASMMQTGETTEKWKLMQVLQGVL